MTPDEALVEMDRQLELGVDVVTGPPELVYAAALHGLHAKTPRAPKDLPGRGYGCGFGYGGTEFGGKDNHLIGSGQGDGNGYGYGNGAGEGRGHADGDGGDDGTGFGAGIGHTGHGDGDGGGSHGFGSPYPGLDSYAQSVDLDDQEAGGYAEKETEYDPR